MGIEGFDVKQFPFPISQKHTGGSDFLIGDPESQGVADAVRSDVEGKLGHFQQYDVRLYKKDRCPLGAQYNFKIQVNDGKFIHVGAFKPIQDHPSGKLQPEMNSYDEGHMAGDDFSDIPPKEKKIGIAARVKQAAAEILPK